MTVDIKILKEHKAKMDQQAFNDVLKNFLPHLRKLVKRKLRQMEWQGTVPKNMYSPQGIVDEVYLRVFESFDEQLSDPAKLKVKMFMAAREVLDEIREKQSGKSVSVETLLAGEVKELQEEYTVNADGNLIMLEDLDDISYHANDDKEQILLLENDQTEELADTFGRSDQNEIHQEQQIQIGKTYSDLPELSRLIIEAPLRCLIVSGLPFL